MIRQTLSKILANHPQKESPTADQTRPSPYFYFPQY
jgi:hypothetical protein